MAFEFKDKNAEALGKASGEALAKGLGVGMDAESYRVITAVENVYVELDSLTKNAAKNAERLAKKQQERKLDNLKNALELELICEQEYYEKLKSFRNENLRYGTDAWYKCTEEIAEYNKRLLDNTQKQYEDFIKERDKLSARLQGSDKWFGSGKTTYEGMGENGSDLVVSRSQLKDFKEEIELLETYQRRLEELKKLEGVPQGIFSDIADMSMEDGIRAMDTILLANEGSRADFFGGYARHKDAADRASAELLGILGSSPATTGQGLDKLSPQKNTEQKSFGELLEMSFDRVPESYYDLGVESGDAFGRGFLTKLPEIMEEVRSYFVTAINQLAAKLTASLKESAQGVSGGTSNTYNTSYTFNSSRDTTTKQLFAARSASILARLRGGN